MGQIQNCPGCPEVSVFLLAENRLLRDTLARLLRKRTAINVVGISRDSGSILNEIADSRCELVLTDCFGSDSNAALLVDLLEQNPDIRILLFGMSVRHRRGGHDASPRATALTAPTISAAEASFRT